MKFNIDLQIKDIYDERIKEHIHKLTNMYLDEVFKGNKVSFYYEDIKTGSSVSFNPSICFYAASSIKILADLMMFEKVMNGECSLEDKILVKMEDLKQDTGIIKFQKEDTYYTLEELMKLTITESDNTAYLKLVSMIGKDKIREYGLSLGTEHTMEGKETDSFGIVNAKDMLVYWKKVKEFIDDDNEYSSLFKEWLLNPSVKLINDESINNKPFIRKYGSYEIAYHEIGYVEEERPYYLMILTQLNKIDYKEEFVNKSAKMINELHEMIKGNE